MSFITFIALYFSMLGFTNVNWPLQNNSDIKKMIIFDFYMKEKKHR